MSNKIMQMMAKIGYSEGNGLGRNGQGILNPIEVQQQFGRQGLGSILNTDSYDIDWDPSKEVVQVEETVTWLETKIEFDVSLDELRNWMKIGPPKLTMDDETNFCNATLLNEILHAKCLLDNFDKYALQGARSRANPFETIRSAFFMNRAALKMANIDAITDFMFTGVDKNPFFKDAQPPFYFADVCAGPGGFTEYILWRKKWFFKGFGLTLKGCNNDFKVDDSTCASGATFQPLFGKLNDGNIFAPENIKSFRDDVFKDTDGKGVHFMMSDGGFSVEGNENLQEILSKQLYACQCLMALEIVRPHGHFVSKLFDVFTQFSAGLLYLMHLCFEKITLHKPNASRPANSERYLICRGLISSERTSQIKVYLRKIVDKLYELKQCNKKNEEDVTQIVPLEIMKKDKQFMKFMKDVNLKIGNNQVVALRKMAYFCANPNQWELRQEELRKQCLAYWQVPDCPKNANDQLRKNHILKYLNDRDMPQFQVIGLDDDKAQEFFQKNDWSLALMHSKNCHLYVATRGPTVYRLEEDNKLIKETDVNIKLVPGTVLFGEIVEERSMINCDGDVQEIVIKSLHVIDALRLGFLDIQKRSFDDRQRLINIYCNSLNFECNPDIVRIRLKAVHSFWNVPSDLVQYNFCEKKYFSILPPLQNKLQKQQQQQTYHYVNAVLFVGNKNCSYYYISPIDESKNDEKPSILEKLLNCSDQK